MYGNVWLTILVWTATTASILANSTTMTSILTNSTTVTRQKIVCACSANGTSSGLDFVATMERREDECIDNECEAMRDTSSCYFMSMQLDGSEWDEWAMSKNKSHGCRQTKEIKGNKNTTKLTITRLPDGIILAVMKCNFEKCNYPDDSEPWIRIGKVGNEPNGIDTLCGANTSVPVIEVTWDGNETSSMNGSHWGCGKCDPKLVRQPLNTESICDWMQKMRVEAIGTKSAPTTARPVPFLKEVLFSGFGGAIVFFVMAVAISVIDFVKAWKNKKKKRPKSSHKKKPAVEVKIRVGESPLFKETMLKPPMSMEPSAVPPLAVAKADETRKEQPKESKEKSKSIAKEIIAVKEIIDPKSPSSTKKPEVTAKK